MLKKLKARWKVNSINLVLIIATFALGGSLCGYTGRKILLLTGLENEALWIVLYLLLITLLWPVCVLLISLPLGQFAFFKKYILKIRRRISPLAAVKGADLGEKKNNNDQVTQIAIFASGAGSNAEKIIQTCPGFLHNEKKTEEGTALKKYTVALIVCNKPGAGVLKIADNAGIPILLIDKDRFFNGDSYVAELQKHKIEFIVLAGFLWKIPEPLILAFPKKIINIHPALLPKFGGLGMYGHKVHEAVIAAKETESGISIHYVDELYDHGALIFQAKCPVDLRDTAETLAQKIHLLEHAHYPKVIAGILQNGC